MVRHTYTFTECEHPGDLNNYENELRDCGATIINSNIDYKEEEGLVTFEVKDWGHFFLLFEKTDSYGFCR
jgi:hypothetical protein